MVAELQYYRKGDCPHCATFEAAFWQPLQSLLTNATIMGDTDVWTARQFNRVDKSAAEQTHPGAFKTVPQLILLRADGDVSIYPSDDLLGRFYRMDANDTQRAALQRTLLGSMAAWAIGRPLLVKFYATWCGFCARIAETWKVVVARVDGPHLKAVAIESERADLIEAFAIRGYPTISLFMAPQTVVQSMEVEIQGRSEDAMCSELRTAVPQLQ